MMQYAVPVIISIIIISMILYCLYSYIKSDCYCNKYYISAIIIDVIVLILFYKSVDLIFAHQILLIIKILLVILILRDIYGIGLSTKSEDSDPNFEIYPRTLVIHLITLVITFLIK